MNCSSTPVIAMSAWQRFVNWYLGIEPAGAGEGLTWSLSLDAPFGTRTALVVLLAACSALIIGLYVLEARRLPAAYRWSLPALRLLALAVAGVWLGGLTLNVVRTGLPTLVLMFDTSASMSLTDQYEDADQQARARELAAVTGKDPASRLSLAQAMVLRDDAALLSKLAQDYRLRVYEFSESAHPLAHAGQDSTLDISVLAEAVSSLSADGRQTRPGPSLRQVLAELRGIRPAAVVVLSDGVASEGEGDHLTVAIESESETPPPIFAVPLGDRRPARDLELSDLMSDPVAFVDQPVTFDVQLKSFALQGRPSRVTLSVSPTSDELAGVDVELPADGAALPLRLSFTPETEGEVEVLIRAEPVPGEVNLENNELRRRLRVRREEIRVLLAERRPRWEYRHLKTVLERDDSVELHTVLQESDLEYLQEDQTALASFPGTKDELFRYDVIILGDLDLSYLNPGVLDLLQEFVRDRGGGLILIAGERNNPLQYAGTPLEALLPLELDDAAPAAATSTPFRIEPTRGGRLHPILQLGSDDADNSAIWSELPPVHWSLEVPRKKDGAVVLAVHETRHTSEGRLPLIVAQRFGAGQVLFHATDELWLWRRRVEDLYYGRYWTHAVRYLSRARLLGGESGVEFTSDRSSYVQGEGVRLRARFVDERLLPPDGEPVTVVAERDAAFQQTLELRAAPNAVSVYEGTLPGAVHGAWHAWIASPELGDAPPSLDFTVKVPDHELRRREADPADLQRAVERTGGRTVAFTEVDELPALLPRGSTVPVATAQRIPLWNRPEWLLLFVTLLSVEWVLRKRARLI
jgi:uncharacterized membrane protein